MSQPANRAASICERAARTNRKRSSAGASQSFTLIELLAVLILMSIIVGMTVLGLDGLSDHGRLRAALGQIEMFDRLTRSTCIADGRTRLMVFETDSNRMVIMTAQKKDGEWAWQATSQLIFGDRIGVVDFLTVGVEERQRRDHTNVVTVRPDGASRSYAVLIRSGVRHAAIVIDGVTGAATQRFDVPGVELDKSIIAEAQGLCGARRQTWE